MFFVGWYWYPKMGHQYHFRGGMVAENGRAFAKVTHTHPRSRALQGILLCARGRDRGMTHTHPRYKPFHGISTCVTLATVQRNAVEEKGRWISGGRVPKGERWRGKSPGKRWRGEIRRDSGARHARRLVGAGPFCHLLANASLNTLSELVFLLHKLGTDIGVASK